MKLKQKKKILLSSVFTAWVSLLLCFSSLTPVSAGIVASPTPPDGVNDDSAGIALPPLPVDIENEAVKTAFLEQIGDIIERDEIKVHYSERSTNLESKEYTGLTWSEIGDIASLYSDYVHINIGDTGDPYVRATVGGVSITNFENDGVVGLSDSGNPYYKYRLTSEFYVLVYTTYPLQHFYSLKTTKQTLKWLQIDRAGAITWGDVWETYNYNLRYNEYDHSTAYNKRNGGAFSLPITCELRIPLQGETIGNYHIMDLATVCTSLSTSDTPAEIGMIGATDPKYTKDVQSGRATGHTTDSSVSSIVGNTDFVNSKDSLESEINRISPGWKSESKSYQVSDNIFNIVPESTNTRLATSTSSTITGVYHVNIGAHAFHTQSIIEVKYAQIRVDVRPPWTGAAVFEVKTIKQPRTTSLNVENFFTKQALRLEVEIYSEIENLNANISKAPTPELPELVEEVNFDDSIFGDTDVEIQLPEPGFMNKLWDFVSGPKMIILLVTVGGILILVLYLKRKLTQQVIRSIR